MKMTSDIKYFDWQYVGLRYEETKSGFPLGFAVPDGTDGAAKKRKESVNRWAGKPGKRVYNVPSNGFVLVDWESRYSTDNKVVRVIDPRGFELEIYIPNLMDLVLNTTIEQGEIKAHLVWIRDGANNRLIRADSPEFELAKANLKKTPKKKLRHEPGDIIKAGNWDDEYLYLGLVDVEYIIPAGEKTVINKNTNANWNWRKNTYYEFGTDTVKASSAGRRHAYINRKDTRTKSNFDHNHVELRVGQMTTYEIITHGHPLPAFDENKMWVSSEDMFYEEDGKVLGFNAMMKIEKEADRHYYDNENVTFWRATVCRIQDGKMTSTPDPKLYLKTMEDRWT